MSIKYEQLIDIINQLPKEEVVKLKSEIEKIVSEEAAKTEDDLENLIVHGPVMSDEKYREFEEHRNHFKRISGLQIVEE